MIGLNQIQGKETTEIPKELYDTIKDEAKKLRMELSDLTQEKVRHILKKLRYNKYYEHCPHITYRLTGIQPPHLTVELEEKLKSMFKQVQRPFLMNSSLRKNFLSYSYVIHKCLQLLEKDEFLPHFCLLKS